MKYDFIHQTVSHWEKLTGWTRDYLGASVTINPPSAHVIIIMIYLLYVFHMSVYRQTHAACGKTFTLQTTSQHKHCGRRQQEETLGRTSWNVNVYCTRTASCEDKPGYLQNEEGSRDALMV